MRKSLFLFPVCFALCGCYVQSLNTFFTDDLKIELSDIEGQWVSVAQAGEAMEGEKITPWVFGEETIGTYDGKNNFSELDVTYFKIGETVYMDFTAGEPGDDFEKVCNSFWVAGITPVHSLCKVILQGDTLVMIPMSYEWFEKRIKEKTLKLHYVKAGEESLPVFTVSSKEWVAFLKQHGDDKTLFNEKYRYVFSRKIMK
ncbi:MAG: hypothetical protein RRC34_04165 [Lentisphaeria bacterium]|nr:hypothetical protein [Lentisphaeria bacterium]